MLACIDSGADANSLIVTKREYVLSSTEHFVSGVDKERSVGHFPRITFQVATDFVEENTVAKTGNMGAKM